MFVQGANNNLAIEYILAARKINKEEAMAQAYDEMALIETDIDTLLSEIE